MRTFRLCDFNSDMVVSYTAWSMNVRDTLPCIHRSHAYFYSLISLQPLGFHAVPFIVNFLSMFGLMSAGFLPISCFHLKNAALWEMHCLLSWCLWIFYDFVEGWKVSSVAGDKKPLNLDLGGYGRSIINHLCMICIPLWHTLLFSTEKTMLSKKAAHFN